MSMEWTNHGIQGIADTANFCFCKKQSKAKAKLDNNVVRQQQESKRVSLGAHLVFSLCPVSFFHANLRVKR